MANCVKSQVQLAQTSWILYDYPLCFLGEKHSAMSIYMGLVKPLVKL